MADRGHHAESDAQTLRKTLVEAAVAAAERESAEIASRARARAEAENASVAERLTDLFEDPDWVTPPSAQRRIAGALAYFGDPACIPEATRSVPGDALVGFVADGLDAELAAWESFRTYRARINQGRASDEQRTRKLYVRRQKLRRTLQA